MEFTLLDGGAASAPFPLEFIEWIILQVSKRFAIGLNFEQPLKSSCDQFATLGSVPGIEILESKSFGGLCDVAIALMIDELSQNGVARQMAF